MNSAVETYFNIIKPENRWTGLVLEIYRWILKTGGVHAVMVTAVQRGKCNARLKVTKQKGGEK